MFNCDTLWKYEREFFHEIGFAAEVADRIIFMDHGQIVETGSAKSIIQESQNPRVRDFFAKVL